MTGRPAWIPILAPNTAYKDTNDWSSECDELF